MLNTLGRSERLKSEKSISGLFETGHSISVPPIRLIYRFNPSSDNFAVKVGFAVPKKNFKRAVDRNLLKRRMRESYRLNKHILPEDNTCLQLEIMLVFQGLKTEDYDKILESTRSLLTKLSLKIPHKNPKIAN
jgi:ribonuclease P protein component